MVNEKGDKLSAPMTSWSNIQNHIQIFDETHTKKEPFCKRQNMVEASGEIVFEAECKKYGTISVKSEEGGTSSTVS